MSFNNSTGLSAMADSTFFSSASAYVVIIIVAALLILLSFTHIFLKLKNSMRRGVKIIYYFMVGVPVYGCGWVIYNAVLSLAESKIITLEMLLKVIGYFIGLTILGYISEKIGRRIYNNFKIAFKQENEE